MKKSRFFSTFCTIALSGLVWQEVSGKTLANLRDVLNQSSSSSRDEETNPASSNLGPKIHASFSGWNERKYSPSSSSVGKWDSPGRAEEKITSSVERQVEKWFAPKLSSSEQRYSGSSYWTPREDDDIASATEAKHVGTTNNTGKKYPASVRRTKSIMERLSKDCWKIVKRFLSKFQKIRNICPKFAPTFTAIINTICDPRGEIPRGKSSLRHGHFPKHMLLRTTKRYALQTKRYAQQYSEYLASQLSRACSKNSAGTASEEGLHSKHILPDIAVKINSTADPYSLHNVLNRTKNKRSNSFDGKNHRLEDIYSQPAGPNPATVRINRTFFLANGTQNSAHSRSVRSVSDADSYHSYNSYYPHLYPYSDTKGLQYLQAKDPEVHIKHPDPVYIYEDATVKPGQYVEVYPGAYQPTYSYSKFPRSYWLFHALKGLFTIWEALQTLAILYLLWKVAVLTVLPRQVEPTLASTVENFLHYFGIPTSFRTFRMNDMDDNSSFKLSENVIDNTDDNPMKLSKNEMNYIDDKANMKLVEIEMNYTDENANVKLAEHEGAGQEMVPRHQFQYGPAINNPQKKSSNPAIVWPPSVRADADLMEISEDEIEARSRAADKHSLTSKNQVHREEEDAIGNQIAIRSKTPRKKFGAKKGSNGDRTSKDSSSASPQENVSLLQFLKLLKSHWREHFDCVGCGELSSRSDVNTMATQSPTRASSAVPLLDASS